MATTISAVRSAQIATRTSGPTPCSIRKRASRLALAFNSPRVILSSPTTSATVSGSAAARSSKAEWSRLTWRRTSIDNSFLLPELPLDLLEEDLLDGDRQPFDGGLVEQGAQGHV